MERALLTIDKVLFFALKKARSTGSGAFAHAFPPQNDVGTLQSLHAMFGADGLLPVT